MIYDIIAGGMQPILVPSKTFQGQDNRHDL